jgi:hypothetical protein
MTPGELCASVPLASTFAGLRTLGLFLVSLVFAIEAASAAGGNDAAQVGLAMAFRWLTALLQIPFAWRRIAMQRGRFCAGQGSACGQKLAAAALTLWTGYGPSAAGAGAVSAATALMVDLIRAPRCAPRRCPQRRQHRIR